jgi:hypothetical protein
VKGSTTPSIELSDNHRRSISIVLQLVDKALCEWDGWIDRPPQPGVMYQQQDFSPTQKKRLRQKSSMVRQVILRLRDDLQLEPSRPASSQMVVGQATVLWEMLAELNSRFLEGYGRVPEELAHYLDPIGEKLAAEMNEISIYDGSHPSSEAISLMMQFRS